ncbi:MAG TPA: relaxase/mobilization nuclease domain-containing protein [Puia sp.]|jgi:hypothetical protein
MHADITYCQSIRRVLHYHNLKILKHKSEFLSADNFIKDGVDLSEEEKYYHFHRLIYRNPRVEKGIVHFALVFHPAERLPNPTLSLLAQDYVQEMGFGEQPYLVYRHNDTNQPHVHVVTTNVKNDGKQIRLTKKDYHRSRQVTRRLEKAYSLRSSDLDEQLEALRQYPLQKVKFGETLLLPIMTRILEAVVPVYRYSSLGELNAVLRLYNLQASRGKEESQTYKKRGLIYLPLKENGQPEGPYLKASCFRSRPTLKKLEQLFIVNQSLREPHRSRLTAAIDWILFKRSLDLTAFRTALMKEQITTVLQKDKAGQLQNIWYIDQQTKSVFEGTALGNRYSAAGIRQRCVSEEIYRQQQSQQQTQQQRYRQRHFGSL